jgi:hypothetical protein
MNFTTTPSGPGSENIARVLENFFVNRLDEVIQTV